jgi:hypothetical protein
LGNQHDSRLGEIFKRLLQYAFFGSQNESKKTLVNQKIDGKGQEGFEVFSVDSKCPSQSAQPQDFSVSQVPTSVK